MLSYPGSRGYQYYIGGLNVNGKRRRLFFRDEAHLIFYLEQKKRAEKTPLPLRKADSCQMDIGWNQRLSDEISWIQGQLTVG
jgi:hypothetical protein